MAVAFVVVHLLGLDSAVQTEVGDQAVLVAILLEETIGQIVFHQHLRCKSCSLEMDLKKKKHPDHKELDNTDFHDLDTKLHFLSTLRLPHSIL
ncbi:hypothetical protein [Halalkalibacter oceani]|uniref:hypothetical protein n=1 Tax=Halalkalibacter oceani TaxID=1653776 RepID=UPI003D815597